MSFFSSAIAMAIEKIGVPAAQALPGAVKLALASTASPVVATLRGARVIGKFLTHTVLGKAIIALVLVLVIHMTFKHLYTGAERGRWTVAVERNQLEKDRRAEIVARATAEDQRVSKNKTSSLDALMAVIVDAIWKTEPPREISAETVDLLNAARDKK